jgi:hypothetical protein
VLKHGNMFNTLLNQVLTENNTNLSPTKGEEQAGVRFFRTSDNADPTSESESLDKGPKKP